MSVVKLFLQFKYKFDRFFVVFDSHALLTTYLRSEQVLEFFLEVRYNEILSLSDALFEIDHTFEELFEFVVEVLSALGTDVFDFGL